jgi:hypothetical protein
VAVNLFCLTAKSGLLSEEIEQIKFGLSLVFYLKLCLAYTMILGRFSVGIIFDRRRESHHRVFPLAARLARLPYRVFAAQLKIDCCRIS